MQKVYKLYSTRSFNILDYPKLVSSFSPHMTGLMYISVTERKILLYFYPSLIQAYLHNVLMFCFF